MTLTVEEIADLSRHMLWIAFLLSMPVLLTALVVGVFVSLLQTVTGVQEMTLTFVPKMLIAMVVLAMALPWMLEILLDYTEELFVLMAGV